MALLFLFLKKLNNSLFVFMTGQTKDNTISYCFVSMWRTPGIVSDGACVDF